jgi:hypothetical protein
MNRLLVSTKSACSLAGKLSLISSSSLRAKRGNPVATVGLDCHVASLLAMTILSNNVMDEAQ